MKRRLITLLAPLLLLLLLCIPQTALAKETAPARPLITCNPCTGSEVWNDSSLAGGLSTVDVPSYTGSSTNVLVRSFILLKSNGVEISIGYCFGTPSSGVASHYCLNNSGNWFLCQYNSGGLINNACSTANFNTGDTGHSAEIGVFPGCGATKECGVIQNTGSGINPCTSPSFCTLSAQTYGTFNNLDLVNSVTDTFTGTLQGHFSWINNQYYISGAFGDETLAGTDNFVNGAGGGWNVTPNGETNEGGTLWECNIATQATC